jgi:hypothetical protein
MDDKIRCLNVGLSINLTPKNNSKWVIDSGATDHMTENQNLLINFRTLECDHFFFTIANDEMVKIKGWAMISILNKNLLQDVLFVENCSVNLLCISKLIRKLNCEIIFEQNNVNF